MTDITREAGRGCACVRADPRMCTRQRYGINFEDIDYHDAQPCECMCHEFYEDEDDDNR